MIIECKSKLTKKKWFAKLNGAFELVHPGPPDEREKLLLYYKKVFDEGGNFEDLFTPISTSNKLKNDSSSSSSSFNSPRLLQLLSPKGPSVRKIAERFEGTKNNNQNSNNNSNSNSNSSSPSSSKPQKSNAGSRTSQRQPAVEDHIKRLSSAEKEKRISELERFGDALKLKCSDLKTRLNSEKQTTAMLRDNLLSVETRALRAEEKLLDKDDTISKLLQELADLKIDLKKSKLQNQIESGQLSPTLHSDHEDEDDKDIEESDETDDEYDISADEDEDFRIIRRRDGRNRAANILDSRDNETRLQVLNLMIQKLTKENIVLKTQLNDLSTADE